MTDSRSILERAARTLPDPRLDLDDVHRRRSRRHRNRRITSAVVALLVASAGTFSAYSLLGGPGRLQPAVDAESFFALWPEQDLESAMAAQERADAMEDGGEIDRGSAWRVHVEQVALRFGEEVWGWEDPILGVPTSCEWPQCSRRNDDRMIVTLSRRSPSDALAVQDSALMLERLVRAGTGGVWSVVETWSLDELRFPSLAAGEEVRPGARVRVQGSHDEPAVAAWGSFAPCAEQTSVLDLREVGAGYEIVIPESVPVDCKGFLMVATGVAPEDTAPMASSLFTDRVAPCDDTGRECDPSVITSAAVTPVRFRGGSGEQVASPSCERPAFGPTYLPWLAEGETVPEPREERIGRDNVLTWDGPGGERVSLITHAEPFGTGVDVDGSIRVMGHPAWLQTIGTPPGPDELTLNWNEAEEPCRGYSIHLLDESLSDERAREEILRIGDSLRHREAQD